MNFVEAITLAVEKIKDWVSETKQDKLTGTEGQVVGFDANGKPVAQEVDETELTDALVEVLGVVDSDYTGAVDEDELADALDNILA